MTIPDWLQKRDGNLKAGIREEIVFVMLSNQPSYRLEVCPAQGQHICSVVQTNNGKRLDDATTYATVGGAMMGGLEQLRTKLGW